jgi:hypothetical protein
MYNLDQSNKNMKYLFFYILVQVIFLASTFGQTAPSLAILYPNRIEASSDILGALEVYGSRMVITDEMRQSFITPDLPDHWKINRTKLLDFLEEQDFFSLITVSTSNQLSYQLNNSHDVLLCFPVKDISSANKSVYMDLCNKHDVSWIINYTDLKLRMENGTAKIEAKLQVYNVVSDHIWLNKTYIVSGTSSCMSSQWECVLKNLIEETTAEIYELVVQKRHYWGLYASKN